MFLQTIKSFHWRFRTAIKFLGSAEKKFPQCDQDNRLANALLWVALSVPCSLVSFARRSHPGTKEKLKDDRFADSSGMLKGLGSLKRRHPAPLNLAERLNVTAIR